MLYCLGQKANDFLLFLFRRVVIYDAVPGQVDVFESAVGRYDKKQFAHLLGHNTVPTNVKIGESL